MIDVSEKKINLDKPSGLIDFLPQDMEKRLWLSKKIQKYFQMFGFQQIEIPMYEFFDLFEFRSGEKIINDIFTFQDPPIHKVKDPKLYALRPEYTAPIVRFYISSELMYQPRPVKVFYVGPCFRYDEPAPGRYRQFTQAGVELFGADTPQADAEILMIAMGLMNELGIENYILRLNDLTFLRTYLEEQNIALKIQNKIFGVIDKITSSLRKIEIGALGDTTEDNMIDDYYDLMGQLQIDRDITETLENLLSNIGTAEEVNSKLLEVFANSPSTIQSINNSKLPIIAQYLKAGGIENFVVDCGIARGLDYYTDMVFEIDVPALGKEKQICGGGRYNKLIGEYGGEETAATGFAFGFERILIALEKQDGLVIKPYRADLYISTFPDTIEGGISLAQELRKEGLRVETDLMGRKLGKSFDFAEKQSIPFVLIVGKKEIEAGLYNLKDPKSGEQFKGLNFGEVVKKVKDRLNNDSNIYL